MRSGERGRFVVIPGVFEMLHARIAPLDLLLWRRWGLLRFGRKLRRHQVPVVMLVMMTWRVLKILILFLVERGVPILPILWSTLDGRRLGHGSRSAIFP